MKRLWWRANVIAGTMILATNDLLAQSVNMDMDSSKEIMKKVGAGILAIFTFWGFFKGTKMVMGGFAQRDNGEGVAWDQIIKGAGLALAPLIMLILYVLAGFQDFAPESIGWDE